MCVCTQWNNDSTIVVGRGQTKTGRRYLKLFWIERACHSTPNISLQACVNSPHVCMFTICTSPSSPSPLPPSFLSPSLLPPSLPHLSLLPFLVFLPHRKSMRRRRESKGSVRGEIVRRSWTFSSLPSNSTSTTTSETLFTRQNNRR